MAVAAIPLMIAATVVSVVGMVAQGMAAKAAGDAQAEQYRRQAEVDRQQGAIAYKRQKAEGQRLRGEQLARMAAAGIDVDVGSPLELRGESQAEYEWRALTDQWGHETRAVQNLNRGALAQFEGQQKFKASLFQAGSKILGTAAQAFSMGAGGGGGMPAGLDAMGNGMGSAPSWGGMAFGRGEIA